MFGIAPPTDWWGIRGPPANRRSGALDQGTAAARMDDRTLDCSDRRVCEHGCLERPRAAVEATRVRRSYDLPLASDATCSGSIRSSVGRAVQGIVCRWGGGSVLSSSAKIGLEGS